MTEHARHKLKALRIQSLQDVQTYRLLWSLGDIATPRSLAEKRQETVKRFLANPAPHSAFADFEDSQRDPIATIQREARKEAETEPGSLDGLEE